MKHFASPAAVSKREQKQKGVDRVLIQTRILRLPPPRKRRRRRRRRRHWVPISLLDYSDARLARLRKDALCRFSLQDFAAMNKRIPTTYQYSLLSLFFSLRRKLIRL
jgi:hypothetical protein